MASACLKALSLNVRGIRDLDKRKLIFTWVKNQKADIVFLRETYSTSNVIDTWGYIESKSVRKDTEDRFVIVEALVQDSLVLLINIYALNKTNEAAEFYENLQSILLESDYNPAGL